MRLPLLSGVFIIGAAVSAFEGDTSAARAAYAKLAEREDMPIEFAVNVGLLLAGFRAAVQLDTGFYPRLAENGHARFRLLVRRILNMTGGENGGALEPHFLANGDVVLFRRRRATNGGDGSRGTVERSDAFGDVLDPIYGACSFDSTISAGSGVTQVYFSVISPRRERAASGPLVVMMCRPDDLPSARQRMHARFEEYRAAVLLLDPTLQMELRFYAKPDSGVAWSDQPTLKTARLEDLNRPQGPPPARGPQPQLRR